MFVFIFILVFVMVFVLVFVVFIFVLVFVFIFVLVFVMVFVLVLNTLNMHGKPGGEGMDTHGRMLTFLPRKKPHKPRCHLILFTKCNLVYFSALQGHRIQNGAQITHVPVYAPLCMHSWGSKWGSLSFALWSRSIVSLNFPHPLASTFKFEATLIYF